LARGPFDPRGAHRAALRARLSSALLDRIDLDGKRHRSVTSRLHPPDRGARRRAGVARDRSAFACFGVDRRAGLWAAGALRDAKPTTLPGVVTGIEAPTLPGMSEMEETAADLWATGMAPGRHPTEFVRAELTARGVVTASALREIEARRVVEVAGVVTHRQQPETANGTIFINLEDETGLINVICPPGCGSGTGRWPGSRRRCGCGACWSATRRDQPAGPPDRGPALTLADALRSRDFR